MIHSLVSWNLRNWRACGYKTQPLASTEAYNVVSIFYKARNRLFWRKSGTQGALTGVGLSIGYPMAINGSPSGVAVMTATPGGPAEKAGILPGDIILAIDNTSTEDMDIYDAAERLQ